MRDHRVQVAAGGGDHAHVDLDDLVAAQGLQLLLLQHTQQLGLQRQRHVADLVEEQGAAVRELELAVAALAFCAGVGAGGDAEELRLQQRLGDRRDIDADEGPRRTRRGRMDALREQLLAGARLAQQQHGGIGGRDAPRLALDLQRRRAGADEAADRVLRPPLLGELAVRVFQLAVQARELRQQRLHGRFRMVHQHQAERADHLAVVVAQRQAADEKGARLVGQQVHEDRLGTTSSTRLPTNSSASAKPSPGRKRL